LPIWDNGHGSSCSILARTIRQAIANLARDTTMRTRRIAALLNLCLPVALLACTSAGELTRRPLTTPGQEAHMDLNQIKGALVGDWASIAPEIRPSSSKNADGTLKPFYLKRSFKYLPGDRFELEIVNSVDPYSAILLARIGIKGHMVWQGPHPSRLARKRSISWQTRRTR